MNCATDIRVKSIRLLEQFYSDTIEGPFDATGHGLRWSGRGYHDVLWMR